MSTKQKKQILTQELTTVCRCIDDAIHPVNMSPEEAKEFLESLQMEIESRLDGLKDDIKEKQELSEKWDVPRSDM